MAVDEAVMGCLIASNFLFRNKFFGPKMAPELRQKRKNYRYPLGII